MTSKGQEASNATVTRASKESRGVIWVRTATPASNSPAMGSGNFPPRALAALKPIERELGAPNSHLAWRAGCLAQLLAAGSSLFILPGLHSARDDHAALDGLKFSFLPRRTFL